MKKFYLLLFVQIMSLYAMAQIVTLNPTGAAADDAATLIFDATAGNGELAGADKVYLHHGIVTDSPNGTAWNNVIGNWGQDDGIGEMSPVAGETDKWQITFSPSIREYFGLSTGENIFRISAVFRSADGNTKGTIAPGDYGWGTVTSNLDMYINLNNEYFLVVNNPTTESSFISPGESVILSASASAPASSMKIFIDEGSGYEELASVSSGTNIQFTYFPSGSSTVDLKFTATVNGQDLEVIRQHTFTFIGNTEIAELPSNLMTGINYHAGDDSKATLVLEAPGKTYGYVVGDLSNWETQDQYQLKQTPDGRFFWLELDNLSPGQAYVFQYWIDGEVKIGDPYAEQVADPWNDPYIDEATFPNIPAYDFPEYGVASVLQTGQADYQWAPSEDSWVRPDVNHIMIYELLVRDFLSTHNFDQLIDTLSYLQRLGVDAIELMPFSEFEGNESWGYNPNYYFAADKYYGPKDDLKRFIETAHQMGMAVIMDVVMNHAYGTNPMVKLYFDESSNRPAADNPWFNRDYVGQYQWGYDWNHEAAETKAFLDRQNAFWIEEYHVDGYRFDFTKGFTNYAPGGSVDGFDQSRIDLLKRMADEIWDTDPDAYIILEHWSPFAEEQQLGDYGMKMWANRSYDYVPAITGSGGGNFNSMDRQSHVSFFNSHDERRVADHALTEGLSNGGYDVKNPVVMFERMKLAAAFGYLFPGPKMMWQFDELGYDIDINFNGRVGNKPLPWGEGGLGYYEDPNRRYIYDAFAGILDVRNTIDPANMASASTNHKYSGNTRRLSYDMAGTDLVVIGNFGLGDESIDPAFTQTGAWYDYFSGEEFNVNNTNANIELAAGEWHIYTTERLSDGLPNVVAVYENPVTITPENFTKAQEITIRFDATKASPGETAGLVGANKVYMHSGVTLDPANDELSSIVGNWGQDDGIGEMTEVSPDIWEITLTIVDYFSLAEDESVFQLGMYFRDADGTNEGYGFRNTVIYYNIESDDPFITIEPAAFTIDDEITITFNAQRGNRELVGANKVYMHSSVDLTNTTTPWNTAWNNVIGNWGQDDGIGEMSPVADEIDQWEISLTPRDYYGLSSGDVAHWLAAVFRSADGNTKGTGTPGPIENGLIHTNQDFFLKNELIVDTEETIAPQNFQLYPNPTSGQLLIQFGELSGRYQLDLIDLSGRSLRQQQFLLNGSADQGYELDVASLPSGVYLLRLSGEGGMITQEVVKQ